MKRSGEWARDLVGALGKAAEKARGDEIAHIIPFVGPCKLFAQGMPNRVDAAMASVPSMRDSDQTKLELDGGLVSRPPLDV